MLLTTQEAKNMNKKLLITTTAILLTIAALSIVSILGLQGFLTPATTQNPNQQPWLLVDGLVQNPLNLSLEELEAMPLTSVNAELYCVDNPRTPVAKGNWTGVRLMVLLERARVSADAVKIAFYANDGFTTDLSLTTASREDIIVAFQKDGTALPEKLRLVVPGKWGYKWIAQLARLELVNYDFRGYYESRGYSDEADIK